MVARVPPEGTGEFVSGTQLIVQDGQIAAFFHDGKPTDGFRAGRYDLKTQNIPILSKLANLATLSGSPFRSCVYFVALKTFTDLGWGTPSPILFRDSEFKMVHLRAYGTFAVRIGDPKLFLHTIVGTQGLQTTHAVTEYLRKSIASRFAETLPGILTTVVDLQQHYSRIAGKLKAAVHDDFDQYGLELVDLLVEAITVPPEVETAINRAAGSRAVDNEELERYERTQRTEALRDAAGTPGSEGGSGLAAGLGIGAGMGLAREMVAGESSGGSGGNADDLPTRLAKLKTLMDEGLITAQDYQDRKNELLREI